MNYNDEEYLALFKKIQNQENQEDSTMLKETYRVSDYPNINEVRRNPQPQNFNMNEFNIETRVNGQVLNRQPQNFENLNEVKRLQKEEKLNEILRIREQERINEIRRYEELERLRLQEEERRKVEEEKKKLNETVNFADVEYVTLEMFNRARFNSMMQVANSIKNESVK